MVPSTKSVAPLKRAGPHVFAEPVASPPTTSGKPGAAGALPPPPPPPAAAAAAPPPSPRPFAPQPPLSGRIHLRLRYLTVSLLTSFSALNRLPLRSPE